MPVAVLTVDDQAAFREAAVAVIAATPGFEPVGAEASGEDCMAALGRAEVDLVLVDARMPGIDGIETTRRIRARHPRTVVFLISISSRDELPPAAARCGAAALVRKQDFGPRLLRGLWHEHAPAG